MAEDNGVQGTDKELCKEEMFFFFAHPCDCIEGHQRACRIDSFSLF